MKPRWSLTGGLTAKLGWDLWVNSVGVEYMIFNTNLCNAVQLDTIRSIGFPKKIFTLNLQNNFAVKSYNWFNFMKISYADYNYESWGLFGASLSMDAQVRK